MFFKPWESIEASLSHALENGIMGVSEAMLAIRLGTNEERSWCLFLYSYIFFAIFIFLRWIKTNQANQRWRMEKCDNDQVQFHSWSIWDFSKAAIHFQKSASLPAHSPVHFPQHLLLLVHFTSCIYCVFVYFLNCCMHQLY